MILCLDYGDRFVGVAITDEEEKTALRHSVIDQSTHDVLEQVGRIVADDKIETVLVGVPVSLSGEETKQTRVSLSFIDKLKVRLGQRVRVKGVDEKFTSVLASQRIRDEGGKIKDEHAEAARLMLADYLLA